MLCSDEISKNKQSLTWWSKYFYNADSYRDFSTGDLLTVPVTDVFPNLRNHMDKYGCEFEIDNGIHSCTNSAIEVCIDANEGILVIDDGHHRFNDAINAGQKQVKVLIKKIKSCNNSLYFALSDNQIEELSK